MAKNNSVIFLGVGIAFAALVGVPVFVYVYVDGLPDDADDAVAEAEKADGAGTDDDTSTAAARPARPDLPELTPTEGLEYTEQDGVKIADIVEGTGSSPVRGQFVKVQYTGWLESNGKMFDSSIARGGPPFEFGFQTGGVIEGWHKGVAGMQVGGKRQLVIPPDLAYGEQGRPPVIPPESTLIFEVELVGLGDIRLPPDKPDLDIATGKTLAKGIKAITTESGDGERKAEEGSVVSADVTIWLTSSDEQFFSSKERRAPMRFQLGVKGPGAPPLEGIDLGVRGMVAGETRILELPPEVGFGDKGFRDQMPGGETLLVQVEVEEVGAPRKPPTAIVDFDREAMTTTESGLMYLDVVEGDGPSPKSGDVVSAEYSGWLEDGTLFDSSYKRAEPIRFPLGKGRVIQAWDEAIATMKQGGKRIIVAPPDIAYGEQDKGTIPPNSTLIFEIELTDIEPSR